MSDQNQQEFSDQEWVDRFLAETTLFLGPDPEIMKDHRLAPRTAPEDRLLSGPSPRTTSTGCASGFVAGSDEANEMLAHIGAASGGKWGDLISGSSRAPAT